MEREQTFVGHLSELRRRIIISIIALVIAAMGSVPFAPAVLKILKIPASGGIEKLAFFSPEEAFVIYMRISLLSGFLIALPVVLYQVWAFILPATDGKFKRYTASFIASCSFIFLLGCVFAYFVLLPNALKFLLGIGQGDLVPVISATKYISFVTGIIFICGLVFQMPVVSFIFTKAGFINAKILRRHFKYAIVIIFIIAAIITPTVDVFNMCMLALPMLALYEVSIWISFFARRDIVLKN